MCLKLCYKQPNNLLSVLKQEFNSLWAKEQNLISCYQLDDIGLPWQQFKRLCWLKSALQPSWNFWRAWMKHIIILSGHKKFQEIQPDFEVVDMTKVRQIWRPSLQTTVCLKEELVQSYGRHQLFWRVQIVASFVWIFRHFSAFFWVFFHLHSLFLRLVPMEKLRVIARSGWSQSVYVYIQFSDWQSVHFPCHQSVHMHSFQVATVLMCTVSKSPGCACLHFPCVHV